MGVCSEHVPTPLTPPPRSSTIKVRHLRKHISFTGVKLYLIHLFFHFFSCKVLTISLAYSLKQNECFAWISALTFVEFCKCKFSEGYCYFKYLCCIFSMMYLCLHYYTGRRRLFSIKHCTILKSAETPRILLENVGYFLTKTWPFSTGFRLLGTDVRCHTCSGGRS